jgi:hypothetical protein
MTHIYVHAISATWLFPGYTMDHMRLTLTVFFLLLPLAVAIADVSNVVTLADGMHSQGAYAEAVKLLLDSIPSASGGGEQAELYWRAARETLERGDIAEKAGTPQSDVLAEFAEGQGYAEMAISSDPQERPRALLEGSKHGSLVPGERRPKRPRDVWPNA